VVDPKPIIEQPERCGAARPASATLEMSMKLRSATLSVAALLVIALDTSAQEPPRARHIAAQSLADVRAWDSAVDRMARDGDLTLRQHRTDPLLPRRTHDRYDQFYQGVRVFGGDLVRQLDNGLTISIFGTLHTGIALDPVPTLTTAQARTAIAEFSGAELNDAYAPELVVLPKDDGSYALAYRGRALSDAGLLMYFIDAHSGELLLSFSDLKSQSAIGIGAGVLGDNKKLSVSRLTNNSYRAEDERRPPTLVTFDLKGNLTRAVGILNGVLTLTTADLATDTDNTWTDPAIVDAHAYSGWVYDYFFKRFGRRGLDGADIPVLSIVHPANRATALQQSAATLGTFYLNAFYAGGGLMVFGEGLPANVVDSSGRSWNYLSGALDVFAHELTHGVTDYSSKLVYRNESGALNEAFSDIMGASAEFYFEPPGNGPMKADYVAAEDVVTGGLRSLANPGAYGDPDHYSKRYTGPLDNGGVHTNLTIGGHAFYLAVEGGVNRTSGLSVTGVGGARREQMEKVFYRAFTQMLPADATFATARAATIQSARDLYGADSPATRAVTEAWTAVGVN
jgi:Zn-dependent metalloprotease